MQYFRFLYSFKVILPIIFFYALSCAIATFIENNYGNIAARAIIYNAWWFNVLHVYLILAIGASFVKSKAWQRKRYSSLILHFSFIVIIIGAGITRFFGEEGMINIPEKETINYYQSNENYINITGLDSNWEKDYAYVKADISPYGTLFSKPSLKAKTTLFNKPLLLESKDIAILNNVTQNNKNPQMIMRLAITYNNQTKNIQVIGGNGFSNEHNPVRIEVGGMKMAIHWGSRKIPLPFGVHLLEFELKTYAGSDNPSSYASEVEIRDAKDNTLLQFKIFMNHVLDFQGYRFYQSNYYTNQNGGINTILSVNKDPGKIPTYIGYTLLIIGCLLILFDKKGRFMTLGRFLHSQKIATFSISFIMLHTMNLYANTNNIDMHGKEIQTITPSPQTKPIQIQNHADIQTHINLLKSNSRDFLKRFAKIQVQDIQGRIQPFDTMAMNIVHKIYKKEGFEGLSNVEVVTGIMTFPMEWANIKIIATSTPKLREMLGVPKNQKYISFLDIYDPILRDSKLKNFVADIIANIPQNEYTTFDKDILEVNERYEIMKGVMGLYYFRAFPDIKTQRWFAIFELMQLQANGEIPQEEYKRLMSQIVPIIDNLMYGIQEGISQNSWKNGLDALKALQNYQVQNGGINYLSENKINWEIWLNHYNIFENLTYPYLLLGIFTFIIALIYIIKDKLIPKRLYQTLYSLILILVVLHTFGLVIRWYVGDHSPWSNAYESMLYIAWAGGIAGVVFFRKYILALCAASFISGISLFVAHLGFMSPQIGNLVPVLQSYWLNIHVCVITASYGFFGLCFILGIFGLLLFIIRKNNRPHIDKAILSVTAINEMSMILGLVMLTIGNFLGGIWANESWGRYWGWDPKETWALISIGIYAIVLHLRFIGFKYMPYIFCSASVLAFYSILMTYYGVNYYLSGMHSYAAGDAMSVQWFVYVFIGATLALIGISFYKSKLPKAI